MTPSASHPRVAQGIEPNLFIIIIVLCVALLCAIAAGAHEKIGRAHV